MEEMSTGYNVVFEYTSEAGLYAGGRFWTTYESKDAFQKDNSPEVLVEYKMKVIAEGVSDEEAIRIHSRMSDGVLWRTAVDEAILWDAPLVDGKSQLSLPILEMSLLSRGLRLMPEGTEPLRRIFHILE